MNVPPILFELEGNRGVIGGGWELALRGVKDGLVPLVDVAEARDDVGGKVGVDVDVLVGARNERDRRVCLCWR